MNPKPSSLDFYAFLHKYAGSIEGSFIKKVYQSAASDFVFQLYGSGSGKNYLLVSLTKGMAFNDTERPEEATPLSMLLRKILSERRIVKVEQVNFDRVVKFTLHTGQEIILEIFRDGNLIVTNQQRIEFATDQREWRNRKILKGEQYIPPSLTDPLSYTPGDISKLMDTSKASAVQTLATRMNLGGDVAEELLFRAGIDKKIPSREASGSSEVIYTTLRAILEEAATGFAYYYEQQNLLSPIRMLHFEAQPSAIYNDLNAGIVEYINSHFKEDAAEDQIAKRIESMKKSIAEFQAKRDTYSESGKFIMSRLAEIDSIISQMSKSVRNSGSLEKGKSYEGYKVENYDPSRKIVTVDHGGIRLNLDLNRTAGQNAAIMFEKSKEFKAKIEGAQRAIADTSRVAAEKAAKVKKTRKKEWYETYHWFISSEGFLVIAGRDAKSNERIVKRHLKDHDIYVHAEVYGAPSTVIKCDQEGQPGEQTLREACNFAVAFSRAWAAGLSSGSAYWVLPSQVSKTPESGEFVTTGAWIVRGKRNYFFDLPMELFIKVREEKGTRVPMIHPRFPDQEKEVHIIPGDMKRQEVAAKISEMLYLERSEIEVILPPGGSRIVD